MLPPSTAITASDHAVSKPAAYAQFTHDAKRQSGLVDVLQKDDDLYFDLGPEQLKRTYIIAPVLAAGSGGEAFAGHVYPSFLVRFKRVGKRVLWVSPNTRYTASPEAQASLDISVADSVLISTPIVAEDTQSGRVVIGASFFLTDMENLGRGVAGHTTLTADLGKSFVERVKAFPKNIEILSDLAFNGPPAAAEDTASEARGVVLKMHYSFLEQPIADGYLPRLADDRVGYFTTVQKRFGDDDRRTPLLHYINRWDLRSGPITYYLSNEIPLRYRAAVTRALLAWGEAFVKIGYPHAIEVKEQPNDPTWDPDDIRYSTVRWIESDTPSFAAYAPTIVNPTTGRILRAEVVIDGEALRTIKRGYSDTIAPRDNAHDASACRLYDCAYMEDSAAFAAIGGIAMSESGASQEKRERYAEEWLHSVILHEAGHTLGLRHNFASSTLYPLQRLHDPAFTASYGLVGSVMDYTPVNLAPKGQSQGAYFQSRLGPYDEWAIRYGYAYIPDVRDPQDERKALDELATQSTRPAYVYGTDEDAEGEDAIDPMISVFDLSSDPLVFDANQFTVAEGLIRDLDRSYPRDDRSYFEERQAFLTIMRMYNRAVGLTCKYIGGAQTSRAHRGQPGGGSPLRPLTREEQRRAFALLSERVFSPRAFTYAPRLLDDLGADRSRGWDTQASVTPSFPISTYIASIQDGALHRLFDPQVMTRLADQQLQVERVGDAVSLGDLFAWTQKAVWEDMRLGGMVHRDLQRRWTNLLIDLALSSPDILDRFGYPGETSALARHELLLLQPQLHAALRQSTQVLPDTAHALYEDIAHRVDLALTARSEQGR